MEEGAFEHVLPAGVDFGYKIRNYRRVLGERRADVDLTLVVPEARDNDQTTVAVTLEQPPSLRRPYGCGAPLQDQNKDFRVRCNLPFQGGEERDFITLKVVSTVPPTPPQIQPKITPYFLDIQLPVSLRVREVANQRTGRPRADFRQDAKAVLRGENLSRVTGVLFGDQSAKIVNRTTGTLLVDIPRLKVEPGQEISVPVTVQTDAGALATGFFFTYDGPPEPK